MLLGGERQGGWGVGGGSWLPAHVCLIWGFRDFTCRAYRVWDLQGGRDPNPKP